MCLLYGSTKCRPTPFRWRVASTRLKLPNESLYAPIGTPSNSFLTSEASQIRLYEEFGYTPTRQAVFRDPDLVASHPELPELEAALATAVLRPLTPVYAQISDLLYRQLSRVFTGRVSPEQGMAQLQQAQEMGFPLQKEELWVKFTQYYFEKKFVYI